MLFIFLWPASVIINRVIVIPPRRGGGSDPITFRSPSKYRDFPIVLIYAEPQSGMIFSYGFPDFCEQLISCSGFVFDLSFARVLFHFVSSGKYSPQERAMIPPRVIQTRLIGLGVILARCIHACAHGLPLKPLALYCVARATPKTYRWLYVQPRSVTLVIFAQLHSSRVARYIPI